MESSAVREVAGVFRGVEGNDAVARRVTNVWMVDNQPVFQSAVASALGETDDLVLGGYFVHPEDALLADTGAKPPDVILIDIEEFGSDGIQAVRQFGSLFPGVPLIVLTESIQEQVIWAAVCAGATGYLLKSLPIRMIAVSIREVISGGAALTPVIARSVLDLVRRLSGAGLNHGLTCRELEILDLMGQGMLMKEIAGNLAISYHTVDSHSRNIYAKLGVRSRTEAVAKALRERII